MLGGFTLQVFWRDVLSGVGVGIEFGWVGDLRVIYYFEGLKLRALV